ncbi:protein of unknown function [Pararobbsia alpina]
MAGRCAGAVNPVDDYPQDVSERLSTDVRVSSRVRALPPPIYGPAWLSDQLSHPACIKQLKRFDCSDYEW